MSTTESPRVFISYSHDNSPTHCDQVLALAQQLRKDGIAAELDQFHQDELQHWPSWCAEQMQNADFVLCICTDEYRRRVENRCAADVGKGVFWEGRLIYNELYDTKGNQRFVPVQLGDANPADIPAALSNWTRYSLSSFGLENTESAYARLYRLLTRQQAISGVELGELINLSPLPAGKRLTDFRGIIASLDAIKDDTQTIRNRLAKLPDAIVVKLGLANAAEAQQCERHYLNRLMQDCAGLEWLDQVQHQDEHRAPMTLNAVYTALLTNSQKDRKENLTEKQRLYSAVDMLNRESRLVITGAPGSGKSALVNFIALCMAGELLREGSCNLRLLTEPLPDDDGKENPQRQDWQHPPLIPIRVVLRDFASSADFPKAEQPSTTAQLMQFIGADLARKGCERYDGILKQRLEAGDVLVLFDGLDEVPQAGERRDQLKQCIEEFCKSYSKNRFLVTVRPYAYEQSNWKIRNFTETQLANFSPGQIRLFIDRWYQCRVEIDAVAIQERAEKLKNVILQSEALYELAERPLLLTLMAFLHSNRHDLPERRADLYERLLKLLIENWEKARFKVLDAEGAKKIEQYSLAVYLQVGVDAIQKVLERLAFAAHANQADNRSGTADIAAKDLSHALYQLAANTQETKRHVVDMPAIHDYLRDRVGILYQRGGDDGHAVYTFPHRSFQEYLAAAYFRREEQDLFKQYPDCDDWQALAAHLATTDPDRWREVVVLAGGIKAHNEPGPVWALLDALVPESLAGQSLDLKQAWALRLAAQILAENLNVQDLSRKHERIKQCICSSLPEVLTIATLAAPERVAAGRYLAKIGDPRSEALTVDRMLFCWVPKGEFFLGSTDADAMADDNEKHNAGLQNLDYGYALAKYPVTAGQFTQFIKESDFQVGNKDCLDGLANQPVVYVSWEEAMAFCAWLTERWKKDLPSGWRVTLPTEREWEKAARGGSKMPLATQGFTAVDVSEHLALEAVKDKDRPQRLYPWGDAPDNEKLNYNMNIGTVSAIGCYPLGSSPYGCEDLSGNVWEWTRSVYENYPDHDGLWLQHDSSDDSKQSRVLRGGGFDYNQNLVRCAARRYCHPNYRNYYIGFRVVLSPLPLDSENADL